jgi:hypothetical protein
MRIYPSPLGVFGEIFGVLVRKAPNLQMAPAMPDRERFRICEVP